MVEEFGKRYIRVLKMDDLGSDSAHYSNTMSNGMRIIVFPLSGSTFEQVRINDETFSGTVVFFDDPIHFDDEDYLTFSSGLSSGYENTMGSGVADLGEFKIINLNGNTMFSMVASGIIFDIYDNTLQSGIANLTLSSGSFILSINDQSNLSLSFDATSGIISLNNDNYNLTIDKNGNMNINVPTVNFISNDILLSGNITISGTATIKGDTTIEGATTIQGATTINNTLDTTGRTKLHGTRIDTGA